MPKPHHSVHDSQERAMGGMALLMLDSYCSDLAWKRRAKDPLRFEIVRASREPRYVRRLLKIVNLLLRITFDEIAIWVNNFGDWMINHFWRVASSVFALLAWLAGTCTILVLGRNHEQPAMETGGEILFALIIVAFGVRVLEFTILMVERPVDKYLNKRLVFFNKLMIPVTALAFIYLASAFAMLLVEVLTELPALQK